jgi:demethylmenaquinone methyltransferase/2-methoxy-6-polyprenyl-1,4-benzoquinol methylase
MINIARKKKGCENAEFVPGDMCAMPFDDNNFDVVTACYAIRNAPDLRKSLDEIVRVTRPGGYICFMDFSKPVNKFLQEIELLALKLWCGLWSWLVYRDTKPYGYIAPSLRAFPDSRELKKILIQSGYIITACRRQAMGIIEIILCKIPDA